MGSVAAYKQAARSARAYSAFTRRWLQRGVASVCCICLVVEMLLVAAARFHYTVDVLMAIILVVLLFDSSFIETSVGRWCEGFKQNSLVGKGSRKASSHVVSFRDSSGYISDNLTSSED